MSTNHASQKIFTLLLQRPALLIFLAIALFLVAASGLPHIVKDTRGDAFLSPDNPALVYRDKVKEQFGLNDPVAVAIKGDIYTPEVLRLLTVLTEKITALDNVNEDKVFSLSTEKNMYGEEGALIVEEFLSPFPEDKAQALAIRDAISQFPLYNGSIVAKTGDVALIIAEIHDQNISSATYKEINNLVQESVAAFNTSAAVSVEGHVAGEAAIAGYLGEYIDNDMKVLNPLAGLIIFTVVVICFWKLATGLFALMMIATTVLSTLGIMAYSGVPFYVITNALPVILIGIAVADTIHILSCYFELQAKGKTPGKDLVIETMAEMWRPVTLTSLTTIAGFLGLFIASEMPPFKFFGLFAAAGVAMAWIYSMTLLPAVLMLAKPKTSKSFAKNYTDQDNRHPDMFTQLIDRLGNWSVAHKGLVSTLGIAIICVGLYSATHVQVDEDRIDTFNPEEAIYKADKVINGHTNGANNLDIIIETSGFEGLFDPRNLKKMEALQIYALQFEDVTSATSIVDYLKQLNMSLNDGNPEFYRLPQDRDTVAQYFLTYSASGGSDEFEEEVDYDYQIANMRLTLRTGAYQRNREIVESIQSYVESNFNTNDINATLTGRVTVDYFWIRDLGGSHLDGLIVALVLVLAMATLVFRSLVAGVLTLIPVATSLLFVYSTMVLLDIPLGIGSSMFASIAIGLGVDFSIHTVDRIKSVIVQTTDINSTTYADIVKQIFPNTGRALLFNFLALASGFGVLMVSNVVPLNEFGLIVVVAVTGSFICSMTLLPAFALLTKPAFFFRQLTSISPQKISAVPVILLFAASMHIDHAEASISGLSADEIMNRVIAVDEGDHVVRNLKMTLVNKRGKERIRETRIFRVTGEEEKRTLVVYESPSNVKGTAFLTYDYQQSEADDDQWLYLPATRRARRISASNRGDYFLGTDFTYEDIKNEGKLELNDYRFERLPDTEVDGKIFLTIRATPRSKEIAKELGYGQYNFIVNPDNWIITEGRYQDTKGRGLKTVYLREVQEIDGVWSRLSLMVENHQTGHSTLFEFSETDYKTPIDDGVFDVRALGRH